MADGDGAAAARRLDWSPDAYARHGGFVPALGQDILAWLAPRAGERILDLGCGEGTLTQKLVAAGACVVGLDASADMAAAACAKGIDARVGNGEALDFEAEFDAVFSNAALHWMLDPLAVVRGIARALKPGGRFVAEFGGHGNVAAIATAIEAATQKFAGAPARAFPWYFPTPAEYAGLLEAAGFTVRRATLVHRPTPLPSGMANWLETFAHGFMGQFEGARRDEVSAYVVALLEPSLRDGGGNWIADYVRLRVEALRRP